MNRRLHAIQTLVLFAVLHSLLASADCAEPPAATQALLAEAQSRAARESKTILVHFHASWCGWCKRLDAFLDQPAIKPVMDRHVVSLRLVAMENDKNKNLENPGGMDLLERIGGANQGLPFFAFLNAKGEMIVNSRMQPGNSNIGHPYKPEEVAWFMSMVRKAAPGIKDAEVKALEDYLLNQDKKKS